MDIKIRKRTRTVREIEIENMQKALVYVRRLIASMRRSHLARPSKRHRPDGSGPRESIEAFLKEASLKGVVR